MGDVGDLFRKDRPYMTARRQRYAPVPNKCDLCGKEFPTGAVMNTHRKAKHGKGLSPVPVAPKGKP